MIKTIFVDLDDVLCDWLKAITVATGKDISIHNGSLELTGAELWSFRERQLGGRQAILDIMEDPEFWINLEKFPWSDSLVETMSQHYEVALLSKASNIPDAAFGKMVWQQRHYPHIPLVLCEDKGLVAAPGKFLIDDDLKQCVSFERHGGRTWLFSSSLELKAKTREQQSAYIDNILANIEAIK